MCKYVISASNGNSLHFMTNEEFSDYEKDALALFNKHHNILKNKYGIWASNQDKYVDSVDKLNDWDNKGHV